jgi:hypothetical protein
MSVNTFLENKAFHLRPETRAAAVRLLGVLGDGLKRIAPETFVQPANSTTVLLVQSALAEFQFVLKAEASAWDLYLVGKKRGLDASLLVDRGEDLFPVELAAKVPDAIPDIRQGTRCMAFELPTAAAYHLHRANEAVFRVYFAVVANGATPPRNRSMGNYLGEMDKLGVGDEELKDSIRNLVKNHRNPLIHPEHSLKDINEAINLMNAIHAVMVPMLRVIPDPPV